MDLSASSLNIAENVSPAVTEICPPWKRELNERLAATRTRRMRGRGEQDALPLPGMEEIDDKTASRASRLAAKVAERYAKAPSYSEVLAAAARAKAEARKAAKAESTASPQPSLIVMPEPTEPAKELAIEEEPVFVAVEPLTTSVVEI